MKKIWFFLLLFLTSCTPTGTSTMSLGKSLEAFDISDKCPNICWLGINPGITSAEDARTLLRASDQIDQETFHVRETYLETNWFFQKTTKWHSTVFLFLEEGLVKSIELDRLEPSTMSDFIDLLGEPDEIKIELLESLHCDDIVTYSVYYSSRKALLHVSIGSWDGPNANDYIKVMLLNTDEFTKFADEDRQPWLGYGHLKEYLPGQKLPTGPCQPEPIP